MENKCTMVTTNTGGLGLREEEEEIELDLGLSIGGSSSSFKKVEKFKPIKKESFDTDLRGNQNHKSFGLVDPLMKREIQALRRQEAKKKREEKQQKKGICRANKNGDHANAADTEARECKRSRREDIKNVNLNLSIEEHMNQPELCPVVPVHYPYPYPKPCPFTNGFAYPGVTGMPCRATGGAERNVVEGSRSFRPLHAGQANGSADGGNRKTTSNGSSAVSDNRSSSHEAGGSSDTKSHSSHSLREQHQLNGSHDHSGSSHLMEVSQVTEETTNCVENMVPSDISQSNPTKPKEESVSDTQPISTEKSVSNQSPSPLEETKGDMSKPPRPRIQNQNTPSLPHMPCVSTTGNGPNGKTINGFLYRYTKTEVSIVCVCHGTSFSPAEFVQHAGGTDITNPLRHITVIPSAF